MLLPNLSAMHNPLTGPSGHPLPGGERAMICTVIQTVVAILALLVAVL